MSIYFFFVYGFIFTLLSSVPECPAGLPDARAVQEVLFQFPLYDGVSEQWLAMFMVEDLRHLKRRGLGEVLRVMKSARMLEEKQLEMVDLVDLQQGQQSRRLNLSLRVPFWAGPVPILQCDRILSWCPLPPFLSCVMLWQPWHSIRGCRPTLNSLQALKELSEMRSQCNAMLTTCLCLHTAL